MASTYRIKVIADKIPNMDLLSKSDPYFTLKKNLPNSDTKIYQSEHENDTDNPHWKEFEIYVNSDTELILTVFDYDPVTNDDIIGSVSFTAQQLENAGILRLDMMTVKETKAKVMLKLLEKK